MKQLLIILTLIALAGCTVELDGTYNPPIYRPYSPYYPYYYYRPYPFYYYTPNYTPYYHYYSNPHQYYGPRKNNSRNK